MMMQFSDEVFDHPVIDVDEWRDAPELHRYVHGFFSGTDLRFSAYFPSVERYGGRFFQPVLPMAGTEHGATLQMFEGMGGSLPFVFDSGAYLVESNMGSLRPSSAADATFTYRASAAAARCARQIAIEMYGGPRPYGYVFGGSGGAFKSIACIEKVSDVWDGAVPFVAGSPMSIPNVFAVQAHAMRLLWDKIPGIVDAIEPGGSGDMYEGLNDEQRAALEEVTRFGFPPRAWFDANRINATYTMLWTFFADTIRAQDPDYFSDFWTLPGYLGATAPDSLTRAKITVATSVTDVVMANDPAAAGLPTSLARQVSTEVAALPVAVRVAIASGTELRGATVTLTSGAASGRTLYISDVIGDLVLIGYGGDPQGLTGVAAGDQLTIDNRDYLAFQTYHRHQFAEGYAAWEQYQVDGTSVYPQRSTIIGPIVAFNGAGAVQSGVFAGKVIMVESMLDEAAYPWQADWYRQRVHEALGDRLDDQFRLWFVDHAMHGAPSPMVVPGDVPRPSRMSRTVEYRGVLEQALRDLAAWVEHDLVPPASTRYEVKDGQVVLPESATERCGVQAVVDLKVEGSVRANVAAGQVVNFEATVEVPSGTGTVVHAEWDFEGDGVFPHVATEPDGSSARMVVRARHSYTEPGTYFPSLRVTSHRRGDATSASGRIHNLGRVRVIVS